MLQYAAGTKVSTNIAADDVATLISNISTQLQAAGWTVASGSGTDITLQCIATPTIGNQMRVRFYLNGDVMSAKLSNVAGSVTQANQTYTTVGSGKVMKIVANRHQFCLFFPGSVDTRNFLFASALYIPPHLDGLVHTAAFILNDAISAVDTVARTTFRTTLASSQQTRNCGNYAAITNASLNESHTSLFGTRSGSPSLCLPQSATYGVATGHRYYDDSVLVSEPLISYSFTDGGSEGKIVGQLWDACVTTATITMDIVPTPFDGKNWINITHSNSGSTGMAKGSLLLVTP